VGQDLNCETPGSVEVVGPGQPLVLAVARDGPARARGVIAKDRGIAGKRPFEARLRARARARVADAHPSQREDRCKRDEAGHESHWTPRCALCLRYGRTYCPRLVAARPPFFLVRAPHEVLCECEECRARVSGCQLDEGRVYVDEGRVYERRAV